ncbi:vWA domain-containing protein [Myceligenerans pegani]|uniref:von Willebrand factor type A domain-containing protein n=1 Tax=Myceligenerans pegani TaxID=2776917 RepID=A0ABR9N152_9MICO|nr:von Willebrand factor type A domain-containing protein [Myceligenerans sp. TRM 65318]MBE1877382.1 von Willebrand factor type A domain-containing protein [Myceligenerans sp. TRM 65318]MBE3019653.1 von Willebrand factor type A domain-containing protein [Myceligenerans sp. TRM 65318]
MTSTTRRRTATFATIAVVVLSLTACGSDGALQSADDAAGQMYSEGMAEGIAPGDPRAAPVEPQESREEYDDALEQPFQKVATSPLSTFSADVDTASYSNLRRQITQGQTPEGVRIEELVNYFDYDHPAPGPDDDAPFAVTTEVADAPWAPGHHLAMIGVQATEAVPTHEGNNIVFLLDVSGSMDEPNKLPLLAESFSLLASNLGPDDVVSIVTYAGDNRVLLDSVPGSEQGVITDALESLSAGGSTGGAAGLETAYELAEKNFIDGGNNRVILATDGDFNVGPSSPEQITEQIEEARESGVYISVLGFGMHNLKDNTMEAIADHGNGNYAYIDTIDEARKVLVDEFDSTMFVVAQDLKLQVELNPAVVSEYRLIGYDNRRLEDEEFDDDTKDAGDVGAGHSVTAFYEIVPASGETVDDDLKYQDSRASGSDDFMTVHVRWKEPGESSSTEREYPVRADVLTGTPSTDFRFASAVVEAGLIARGSDHAGDASLESARSRAAMALGADPYGLRGEFVALLDMYRELAA